LLDVGCGDGLLIGLVKQQNENIQCAGVDFSENAVNISAKKYPDGYFVRCNVATETLPFSDDSFDTVIALDILEHLFHPKNALIEMRRISRHDVIIGVPNFSSFPARIQALFGRVPENNFPKKSHVYWFNKGVLLKMLIEADFEVKDIKWNYQFQNVPVLRHLTKLLCRLRPSLFALSFVVRAEKNSSSLPSQDNADRAKEDDHVDNR